MASIESNIANNSLTPRDDRFHSTNKNLKLNEIYTQVIEADNLAQTILRSAAYQDSVNGSHPDLYAIEHLSKVITSICDRLSRFV